MASKGKIEIYFQGYPLDHETKIQFIEDINGLGEISIPEKAADTWSSFPLSCLGDKSVLERFNIILEKLFT